MLIWLLVTRRSKLYLSQQTHNHLVPKTRARYQNQIFLVDSMLKWSDFVYMYMFFSMTLAFYHSQQYQFNIRLLKFRLMFFSFSFSLPSLNTLSALWCLLGEVSTNRPRRACQPLEARYISGEVSPTSPLTLFAQLMFVLSGVAFLKPSSFVSDSAPTVIVAPIVSAALPCHPLVTVRLLSLGFCCFVQTFLAFLVRRFWLWNWLSLCRLSDDLTQSSPSVLFSVASNHLQLVECFDLCLRSTEMVLLTLSFFLSFFPLLV
jgi:hypothetical protein